MWNCPAVMDGHSLRGGRGRQFISIVACREARTPNYYYHQYQTFCISRLKENDRHLISSKTSAPQNQPTVGRVLVVS